MNVKKEVVALERLTVNDLRERYAEVYGEPTNGRHKQWLVRRIVWRMQALEEGDLSERARRRAREIANDADVRVIAPKAPPAPEPVVSGDRVPIPGSTIVRRYKGRQLEVRVLDGGFEYEGERFGTLSAVAKSITGSHCSGYRFFGLPQEKAK
ncbi:MAG TPA: DUF2924 domain-containing protein [Pirellulaceae bacterium]|jgi:hypothetical protein|nr:DUF2924 domain-containing protein [Pirellulaceae bacterium]